VPTTAGFHMVVLCKVPIDVPLVIELAKVEVGLYPINIFYYQQPLAGLFLGFGAIDTLDIDTALDRLRDILQQVA
jgi:GntR family transcriptional regulator/MocR family aminotransferase